MGNDAMFALFEEERNREKNKREQCCQNFIVPNSGKLAFFAGGRQLPHRSSPIFIK